LTLLLTSAEESETLVTKDSIIDEVRKNRDDIAKRFNYDLKAIIADARKRQRGRGKKVVSFARPRKKRTA
jgi:hypothetical protein